MSEGRERSYWKERKEGVESGSIWIEFAIASLVIAVGYWLFDFEDVVNQALWFAIWAVVFLVVHYGLRLKRYCFDVPKAMHFRQLEEIKRLETKAQFWFDTRNELAEEQKKSYQAVLTNQTREIFSLREQVEKKRKDQYLADTLTAKYREGVGLLNTPMMDHEDLFQFKKKVEEWLGLVVAFMKERNCTVQELAHVETLHKLPDNVTLHTDTLINHHKLMLWVRLDRVKSVINSYASNPILWDE